MELKWFSWSEEKTTSADKKDTFSCSRKTRSQALVTETHQSDVRDFKDERYLVWVSRQEGGCLRRLPQEKRAGLRLSQQHWMPEGSGIAHLGQATQESHSLSTPEEFGWQSNPSLLENNTWRWKSSQPPTEPEDFKT